MPKIKSSFCDSTAFIFHKIVAFMDCHAQKILQSKLDISYFQFLIMCMIDSKPKVTQKQVSVMLNYTEAAVSKQVEILRKSGFLSREVDKNNRRQHVLGVTDLGQQVVQKAYKLLSDCAENLFQTLEKPERKQFDAYLQKLSNFTQIQNNLN